MEPAEEILCDYCETAKVQLVCQDCFQGMWCSEKCHLADAADHDEYFCYHPDDLSDECVLEEMQHVTHDPQEAREMMKEMIGDDLIEAYGSGRRRREIRKRRRETRRRRRQLRRERLKAKKERRKLARERRERRRLTKEQRSLEREEGRKMRETERLRRAQEKRLKEDGIERVRPDEPLPDEFYYDAEAAQIASFIL